MKRIKWYDKENNITLWDAICDIDNIRLAHKKASKGKRWYKEVKMVNSNLDFYLYQIQDMLKNHRYKVSSYEIFERQEGEKIRTIYKLPYYPDRIIQWAVILIIGPILEKRFINTTYSSIKKRGQHQCFKDVKRAVYRDKNIYCLKIDIKKFYPSVDQSILKQQYAHLFKDKELLDFIYLTIDSVDKGVPIGNYLSQYSGNFYLSPLDHWLKEVLKIPDIYRYMDDIVILGQSKSELRDTLEKIGKFLKDKLKLQIKSNYQIFPIAARGIDFVGYRIFKDFSLVRRRTVKHFKQVYTMIQEKGLTYSRYCSYMSYRGLICHANSFRLLTKYPLEVSKCQLKVLSNLSK